MSDNKPDRTSGNMEKLEKTTKPLEIRGFLQLDSFLRKKYGSMPFYHTIEEPMSGLELSQLFEIERDDIEVIFVNGFVQELDFMIQPGDRIAFLPPGCPGPYRIALGFYGKNQGNESSFKLKNKDEKENQE